MVKELMIKTQWKDISCGRAGTPKVFKVPDRVRIQESMDTLTLVCPWCLKSGEVYNALFSGMGKSCECGALLTSDGNAYKIEELL